MPMVMRVSAATGISRHIRAEIRMVGAPMASIIIQVS